MCASMWNGIFVAENVVVRIYIPPIELTQRECVSGQHNRNN